MFSYKHLSHWSFSRKSIQPNPISVCLFFSVSSVLLKDVFSVLSSAGSAPEAKFTGTQILLKYCCQECEINYLQCRRSLSVINCNSNGKLSRKKKTSGGELGRFAVKCHTLVHLVFSLTTDLFREHLQQSSWVVISRHLKCWQEGFIQRIKWVLDGGVDCWLKFRFKRLLSQPVWFWFPVWDDNPLNIYI